MLQSFFSKQNIPDEDFEILWIEFYDKINKNVEAIQKVKTICLNNKGQYHSSICFNEGIKRAEGEIIVIPDADQIVEK